MSAQHSCPALKCHNSNTGNGRQWCNKSWNISSVIFALVNQVHRFLSPTYIISIKNIIHALIVLYSHIKLYKFLEDIFQNTSRWLITDSFIMLQMKESLFVLKICSKIIFLKYSRMWLPGWHKLVAIAETTLGSEMLEIESIAISFLVNLRLYSPQYLYLPTKLKVWQQLDHVIHVKISFRNTQKCHSLYLKIFEKMHFHFSNFS